ncbi:MAG: precorrin-6Y C5,15-methyltransferase (decarboxylating) subunit CbiT, partial [Hominilimicola sp.]
VYAVEKKSDAAELIEKNAVKFMADNIEVIQGEAPDVLDDLPKADRVFIGGSSGTIAEIIRKCDCPKVVVNAITLETLEGTLKVFDEQGYTYEVTQISAAYAKKVAGYNMMTAQNPVFVISGEKE